MRMSNTISSGVEFVVADDGTIGARHLETGLARGGDSKAEAPTALAEVLGLHEGGGESIDDPDEFHEDPDINPAEDVCRHATIWY